jgi:hypothetical protein
VGQVRRRSKPPPLQRRHLSPIARPSYSLLTAYPSVLEKAICLVTMIADKCVEIVKEILENHENLPTGHLGTT